MHFRRHQYVSNQSPNAFTHFGDDRSNSKEMAAVFRNLNGSKFGDFLDRRPPHSEFEGDKSSKGT